MSMFGNMKAWWNTPSTNSNIPKEPDVCDLCGKGINKEDSYYTGATHHSESLIAWAFTCINLSCSKWLIHKDKRIKEK